MTEQSERILTAAYILAMDYGLISEESSNHPRAIEAYVTFSGFGDSAELLRSRGADPDGVMADDALLSALLAIAVRLK